VGQQQNRAFAHYLHVPGQGAGFDEAAGGAVGPTGAVLGPVHAFAPSQEKAFFSEEKKQKTFIILACVAAGNVGRWMTLRLSTLRNCNSFLVLFFKKELPYFVASLTAALSVPALA
jgi:hypothetical protein